MSRWSVRGRHLPALDGIRALAVIAVVVYHLGFGWARGGYLGVDLFFVLSGFLITSLLLEEHEDLGRVRLSQFWARRARRLLPALFLMVTVVMVYVVAEGRYGKTAAVAALDLHQLRAQAVATLLYVANWEAILAQHSYFAQFAAPNPLLHTWSLAIEEQFYLLWPFVTVVLLAKGLARRRATGTWVSVGIAACSALLMAALFTPGGDPSRVYYSTFTRLQDLAVGTVLAWLTARRPETPRALEGALRVLAPLSLAGLLVLMVTAGTSDGVPLDFMFRGGFLLAAVLCAIVIADVRRDDSVLARGFSLRAVVAIGVVSYGVYLWHWPVITLLTGERSGLTGAWLTAARLALIAALTVASYFLIELPVRRQRLSARARWVAYPLGVAITVGAVFLGTTPSFVVHSRVRATLIRYAPAEPPAGSGGLAGQRPIDLGRTVSATAPMRVALVGDSMMELSAPGIRAALEATGEVVARNFGFPGWGTSTDPSWRGYLRHAVRASHAEVVMVTTGWDGTAALAHPRRYRATLVDLVDTAVAAGAKGVVFVEYPRTHPIFNTTPARQAATDAQVAAWNRVAASVPAALPGEAMWFPVAGSVEYHGAYSAWLPPPRDPGAPRATWDRMRRLDGVHLCAAGIVLYAAPIAADTSSSFGVPEPQGRWWVNGWQRDPLVRDGAQFCPADHPPS